MHIEVRGPNDLPYVYKNERGIDGEPHNIYVGKLDYVLAEHRSLNGWTPTVGLTQFGKPADISISIHDISSKKAMTAIYAAIRESENTRPDPAKQKRNEAILVARSMAKAGIKYDRIAHELSTIMKRKIGKGTAHKWANKAKLSKGYYDPEQDHTRIAREKGISNQLESEKDEWGDWDD